MTETIKEYIEELEVEVANTQHENKYLVDFIAYKKLTDEFVYFRQHAHEECPEDCPFPYYTL